MLKGLCGSIIVHTSKGKMKDFYFYLSLFLLGLGSAGPFTNVWDLQLNASSETAKENYYKGGIQCMT